MKNLLSNLEASYSNEGEIGCVKSIASDLWRAGFTAELVFDSGERYVITDLEGIFSKRRYSLIFKKDECPYSFVFIYKDKNKQGCLIDVDALSVAGNNELGLNKSKKSEVDFHIYFDDEFGRHKLHDAYMGVTDDKVQVDHVTRRSAICIKEMLRKCTAEQNSRNKKVTTNNIKLQKKYFTLSSVIIPDDEIVRELEAKGYKLTNKDKVDFNKNEYKTRKFELKSPKFTSVEELYKALNEVEDRFYGEYRYNPIYAFDDVEMCGGVEFSGLIWTYLYMETKLLGLDEEEFVSLRKAFLKKHCPDMCDYYGIF